MTKDLVFRGKLGAVVEGSGWEVSPTGPAPVVVIEVRANDDLREIERHLATGAHVIVFGSHVEPRLLRAARALGAAAFPNSDIAAALQRKLAEQ